MWIVPGVVGAALAGASYPVSGLFLFASFLLFWARYPIWAWARSRSRSLALRDYSANLLIGLVGLALVAGLGITYERWALLALGTLAALVMALHLRLVASRHERDVATEFLGIFGLGLVGPATYYTASGNIDGLAAMSWLLPTLFFGTSVFSVKLRVEGHAHIRAGRRPRALSAALAGYQTLAIATVLLLIALNVVAPRAIVAYIPVTLQAAWLARGLSTPPRLRRLGLLWVAHSALFTILLLTLM